MKYLNLMHPLAQTILLFAVLIPTLFISDPILISFSMLGGILCLAGLGGFRRGRAMIFPLLLILASAIMNPLFSHRGATELFFVNGNPYTLEALVNGTITGLSFAAAVVWCMSVSLILKDERILYLIGGRAPKTALVLTSTLRMIPEARRKYIEIRDTQRLLGRFDDQHFIKYCRSLLAVWSALISQMLEDSKIHAILLETRCAGVTPTMYGKFKRRANDNAVIAIVLILLLTVVTLAAFGLYDISFYPVFKAEFKLYSYIMPALLFIVPSVYILFGAIREKLLLRQLNRNRN